MLNYLQKLAKHWTLSQQNSPRNGHSQDSLNVIRNAKFESPIPGQFAVKRWPSDFLIESILSGGLFCELMDSVERLTFTRIQITLRLAIRNLLLNLFTRIK